MEANAEHGVDTSIASVLGWNWSSSLWPTTADLPLVSNPYPYLLKIQHNGLLI